jgi:hypothetical protein
MLSKEVYERGATLGTALLTAACLMLAVLAATGCSSDTSAEGGLCLDGALSSYYMEAYALGDNDARTCLEYGEGGNADRGDGAYGECWAAGYEEGWTYREGVGVVCGG